MEVNVDIKNNLTADEQEVFSILNKVAETYAPSTQVFVVGGWVRDKLTGGNPYDIDVMIDNMSGEKFAKLVAQYLKINDPHVIKENPDKSRHVETATMMVPLSSGKELSLDFVQSRTEVYDDLSRVPTEVNQATPQEDASRRDLTINALFYDIRKKEITDYTGMGIKDLISGTIRAPGNPIDRFMEDPLRILRTIRFASKYDAEIEPKTYEAMLDPSLLDKLVKSSDPKSDSYVPKALAKEKVGEEIGKMLSGPNPVKALELMKATGIFGAFMQEALIGTEYEGKLAELDMEQKNAHHDLTLWGHTLQAIQNLSKMYPEDNPDKRVIMIWAAVVHDLGKLFYDIHGESKSVPGNVSYHGHEKESQKIAQFILKYLKRSNDMIDQVSALARNHMRPHNFTEQGVGSQKAMRTFIRQMGERSLNWLDVFNMAMADAQSKSDVIDPSVTERYQGLERQLQEALLSMGPIQENRVEPILNGNEIMQILNIKGGAWMSEIMAFVVDLKDTNPTITKEEATNLVRARFGNQDIMQQPEKTAGTPGVKGDKTPDSVCPMHLFKTKHDQICDLFEENKPYEVMSILKELKEGYGNDERVVRLLAANLFKILREDQGLKDNDLLLHVFGKAEDNFFDSVLCAFVLGILLVIPTSTEDEVLEDIGERVAKMAPGTLRSVLDELPKDIPKPQLKTKIEGLIK